MKYYLTKEDALYHHGIKGQKWGIRRWQNEDGSFNEEGKKRYFGIKSEIKSVLKSKLSDPKIKKALKVGISVAGSALAIYGSYKISRYFKDQKVLMALNDKSDVIKRMIPNYKADIIAMNRGLVPKDNIDTYMKGLNNNKKILSEINSASREITKKHLYNFGENVSLSDYNDFVSKGKKIAKNIGEMSLKAIKETANFIVNNSSSIAEILEAVN